MATAILGAEDDVDGCIRGDLTRAGGTATERLSFNFFIRPQYTLPRRQFAKPDDRSRAAAGFRAQVRRRLREFAQ